MFTQRKAPSFCESIKQYAYLKSFEKISAEFYRVGIDTCEGAVIGASSMLIGLGTVMMIPENTSPQGHLYTVICPSSNSVGDYQEMSEGSHYTAASKLATLFQIAALAGAVMGGGYGLITSLAKRCKPNRRHERLD